LALLSCNSQLDNTPENLTIEETSKKSIKLHKLNKLLTIGDFNGDGKQDTIFQHHVSGLTNSEIEYAPDPFENDWDTVVKWFYEQKSKVNLTFGSSKQNILDLGTAHGLYCLINIGDNNYDQKDEIALVVDCLDYSRVNSCTIYTLCKNHLKLLKQFQIHEDAFNFNSKKAPVFYEIKEFLERRDGIWIYKDYAQIDYDNPEDVGKMLPLKLGSCN
jgi:hypothetical protein